MRNQSKIKNQKSKITIVGAGPAGASLAIRLAEKQFDVILIEREKFPRQKLCGEFISPECLEHFRVLGVLDEMLFSGGDRITETVFYAPNGRNISVPSKWFGNGLQGALSLSRAEMDFLLLEKAKKVGVRVLEETSAVDLLMEAEGEIRGVKVKNKAGEISEIAADLTVDASGRAGVLGKYLARRKGEGEKGRKGEREKGRRGEREKGRFREFQISNFKFQKTKNQRTKDKGQRTKQIQNPKSKIQNRLVGFKAHLKNVSMEKSVCEIYFFRGGYGGLSFVENGLANHCFLIQAKIVKEFNGNADKIVENVVLQNKRAFSTLKNAELVYDWLAVSVDEFGRKDLSPAPNLLTVGDASAFIDPFTGSGMLMALEGAEVLAEILAENHVLPREIADKYKVLHREKFQKRLFVCSVLRRAAFVPAFAKLAISALSLSEKAREFLARSTRNSFPVSEGEK